MTESPHMPGADTGSHHAASRLKKVIALAIVALAATLLVWLALELFVAAHV